MNTRSHQLFLYATIAAIALMAMLFVSYFFRGMATPALIASIAIILFEITVPIEVLKFLKMSPRDCHIYAHNIDTVIDLFFPPFSRPRWRPDFIGMRREMWVFFKVSVLLLPMYVLFYWAFFRMSAIKEGSELVVSLNFPPKLVYEIITQIFVIALPEELFYRGFLQSAFLSRWPNRTKFLGLPLGRAVLLTNLIFAFGHVASSLNPVRMLTFFPGLIFSYLVYKNKSLLSAVLFHAACNILGQVLYASLFLR